jgi:hypothetical protein
VGELEDLRLELASIAGRLDDHERLLQDLAADKQAGDELAEIVMGHSKMLRRLQQFLADPDKDPRPWHWYPHKWARSLKQDRAEVAWQKLVAFVDELLIPIYDNGFGELEEGQLREGDRIKSCWFAHPNCVEWFSALYWDYLGSYRVNAERYAPDDFTHARVDKCLTDVAKMQKCSVRCARFVAAMGEDKARGWIDETTRQPVENRITHMDRLAFIRQDIAKRNPADEPLQG